MRRYRVRLPGAMFEHAFRVLLLAAASSPGWGWAFPERYPMKVADFQSTSLSRQLRASSAGIPSTVKMSGTLTLRGGCTIEDCTDADAIERGKKKAKALATEAWQVQGEGDHRDAERLLQAALR